MKILSTTLATTALGLASVSAQAHPGHALENLLAQAIQHGIESLFVASCAVCLGGYLAYRARRGIRSK
jgi:hypothetical protein